MTSHKLAELLLKCPDLPVHAEPNGYDVDDAPEVKHIGKSKLYDGATGKYPWKKTEPVNVILLCADPILLDEEIE